MRKPPAFIAATAWDLIETMNMVERRRSLKEEPLTVRGLQWEAVV